MNQENHVFEKVTPIDKEVSWDKTQVIMSKTNPSGIIEYANEVFDNPNQLSIRLSLSRQYINDSFTGAKTKHNIFNNLKQLNNIIEYCNKNEIIIDVEFLNKYSVLLENRH